MYKIEWIVVNQKMERLGGFVLESDAIKYRKVLNGPFRNDYTVVSYDRWVREGAKYSKETKNVK